MTQSGAGALDAPANARRLAGRGSIWFWLGLLLAAGLAARAVRYSLNFPLWGDEAFVAVDLLPPELLPAEMQRHGLADLLRPLTYGQIVPLGFMAAELLLSRWAGPAEWALRLIPLACGVLALGLFARLALRELPRRAALLAVGFLAVAYYCIRHGAEVKPYTLDLLVSLLFTMQAWGVGKNPQSRWRWVVLIAFAPLAVWCSYPAAFVGGGVTLFLARLAWRERSRLLWLKTGIFALALGLGFVSMYLLYARPHAAYAARVPDIPMWQETFPPITQPLKLLLWALETHAGNLLAYPIGGRNGGSALTLLLVLAGVAACWKKRRDLLVLLLAPLVFNFIAAALHRYPYGGSARTSLFLAPAFCLLAGAGLSVLIGRCANRLSAWHARVWPAGERFLVDRFGAAPRARSLRLAACGLLAVGLGSIAKDLIEPYKKAANQRCRALIAELGRRVAPHDVVLAFHTDKPDVQHAPYIAIWKGDGAQFVFYLLREMPVTVQWAPPPGQVIKPADGGRAWLVAYGGYEFELIFAHAMRRVGRTAELSPHLYRSMLDEYVAALQPQLGPPTQNERAVLERKGSFDTQVIETIQFGP